MSVTSLNAGAVRAQRGGAAGTLATTGARVPRHVQLGFRFAAIDFDPAMLAGVCDAFATARNTHI